jgi:hypothetical protein
MELMCLLEFLKGTELLSWGRKYTTTQNVLAAVDFDLRFTYVLAGVGIS